MLPFKALRSFLFPLVLFCVCYSLFALNLNDDLSDIDVSSAMRFHQVVPDIVEIAPTDKIEISYRSGVNVEMGKELTPTQVKDEPEKIEWPAESGSFYTLFMIDPDAPRRTDPVRRSMLHWLLGNIPGNDINRAEILCQYIGSGAPNGTGLHRYVFLVYKQPSKLNYDEELRISKKTKTGRVKFSVQKFATRYNLEGPVAGNLFQAQYDDYVPFLKEQISQE